MKVHIKTVHKVKGGKSVHFKPEVRFSTSPQNKAGDCLYYCDICDYTSQSERGIKSHITRKHGRQALENENKIDEHLEKISDGIFEEAIKLAEGNADRETKLKMFAYLIATKRLEIKFAFPHHVRNPNVFHQKYGIFRFQNDDKIGFLGSPNETIGGHAKNIETIEVFNSTIPSDLNRINSWEKKFNRSWENEAKGCRTKEISKKTNKDLNSLQSGSLNLLKERKIRSMQVCFNKETEFI